jgi:hypothetical protein
VGDRWDENCAGMWVSQHTVMLADSRSVLADSRFATTQGREAILLEVLWARRPVCSRQPSCVGARDAKVAACASAHHIRVMRASTGHKAVPRGTAHCLLAVRIGKCDCASRGSEGIDVGCDGLLLCVRPCHFRPEVIGDEVCMNMRIRPTHPRKKHKAHHTHGTQTRASALSRFSSRAAAMLLRQAGGRVL